MARGAPKDRVNLVIDLIKDHPYLTLIAFLMTLSWVATLCGKSW